MLSWLQTIEIHSCSQKFIHSLIVPVDHLRFNSQGDTGQGWDSVDMSWVWSRTREFTLNWFTLMFPETSCSSSVDGCSEVKRDFREKTQEVRDIREQWAWGDAFLHAFLSPTLLHSNLCLSAAPNFNPWNMIHFTFESDSVGGSWDRKLSTLERLISDEDVLLSGPQKL